MFSSEPVQYRPVKGRTSTPGPQNEELEWLNLQDEAELMGEVIREDMELEKNSVGTPISTLSNTRKLSLDGARLSLPAFKNFCSLAFRRNKTKDSKPKKDQNVIYSTAIAPRRTKPDLKLSFAANTFVPGRTSHGGPSSPWVSCKGRPRTPCASPSFNAESLFAWKSM